MAKKMNYLEVVLNNEEFRNYLTDLCIDKLKFDAMWGDNIVYEYYAEEWDVDIDEVFDSCNTEEEERKDLFKAYVNDRALVDELFAEVHFKGVADIERLAKEAADTLCTGIHWCERNEFMADFIKHFIYATKNKKLIKAYESIIEERREEDEYEIEEDIREMGETAAVRKWLNEYLAAD